MNTLEEEVVALAVKVHQRCFSEMVTMARAMSGAESPDVQDRRNRVVRDAVRFGIELGHSPEEVVDLCEPVPITSEAVLAALRGHRATTV